MPGCVLISHLEAEQHVTQPGKCVFSFVFVSLKLQNNLNTKPRISKLHGHDTAIATRGLRGLWATHTSVSDRVSALGRGCAPHPDLYPDPHHAQPSICTAGDPSTLTPCSDTPMHPRSKLCVAPATHACKTMLVLRPCMSIAWACEHMGLRTLFFLFIPFRMRIFSFLLRATPPISCEHVQHRRSQAPLGLDCH